MSAEEIDLHRNCHRYVEVDGVASKDYAMGEGIKTESYGVSHDTPYPFSYRGKQYVMPVGYSSLWEGRRIKENLKKFSNTERKGVWFHFWMPSLRHVERYHSGYGAFRPCETGRPMPEFEDFTVRVQIPGTQFQTPDELYKRHLGYWAGTMKDTPTPYGLIRYDDKGGRNTTLDIRYRTKPNADIQMNIQYNPNARVGAARATLYRASDKLRFSIAFPSEHIPYWEEIATNTLALFDGWEVDAKPAPTVPGGD